MDATARKSTAKWLAGAVLAVAVVAAVLVFFNMSICEEQLADDGTVVEVCRRLEASDPPVIAFGIVLLVAVGAFFTEVQGFGVTLKRNVEQATEAAEAATAAATSAEAAAANAKATAADADRASAIAREVAELARKIAEDASAASMTERRELGTRGAAPGGLEQALDELADEYNATRATMPSGTERTSIMTTTVSKLISLLGAVDESQFDLAAHLRSGDRGRRLAAYAYLYANPHPARTPELVGALIEEDKPFGQYWALRALQRHVQSDPAALDGPSRRRLEELGPRFAPGTNEARELASILAAATG